MGIVDLISDLKGPVFYKDDSEAEKELAEATKALSAEMLKDIKNLPRKKAEEK